MKIVMLANNPCVIDARIKRAAAALAAAGHDVTVLATYKRGLERRTMIDGVDYRRILEITEMRKELQSAPFETSIARRLEHLSKRLAFAIGRTVVTPSLRHLFGYARAYTGEMARIDPDVVHAHDLDTLLAGWIGARRAKARLIYDAHELETDRNQITGRLETAYRAIVERWLIRRSDAVITVSNSIADYLADRYRIERPRVILNAPAAADPEQNKADLRADLCLAPDIPLALYVGGVIPGRGIEQAIRALPHLPMLHLAALGPREDETEKTVLRIARDLGVLNRLHLVDPVPPGQLEAYIRRADVSLILLQNTCLNHSFCFPNKLLQSLLAGIPVVVARLVELERMINTTGAGRIADETDPKSIAAAIAEILAKPGTYRPDNDTIGFLQASYGWPAQRACLLALYDEIRPMLPASRGTSENQKAKEHALEDRAC